MMEYNDKYKQSVYEDDLFQEDSKLFASKEQVLKESTQQQPVEIDSAFKQLNPASTTSSLERDIKSAQKLPEVQDKVNAERVVNAHISSAVIEDVKVQQL